MATSTQTSPAQTSKSNPGPLLHIILESLGLHQAVFAAAELGVADLLADQAMSTEELMRREGLEPLTEREHEVLQLLADGASNREIAHRLILSIGTVKKYVYNICSKLSVQSRTRALARARALHLL